MAWDRMIVAGVIAALWFSPAAHADDAVTRGAAVVDQWCHMCHQRVTDKPDPNMAPSYEEIVRWEGRDEAYFVRFMQEDHFPMTTFRLFDHEKAEVVAYLMALQRGDVGRP